MKKDKKKQEVIVGTLEKSVVESLIWTRAKHNLSIYGERLLLKLVEIAQSQVYGLDFKGGSGICRVSPDSLGTVIELNIKDLLPKNDVSNYDTAKAAVKELISVHHEDERPLFKNNKQVFDEDGNPVYQYEAHQLLNDVYINSRPGTVIIEVNRHTWEAILDFSKGWRRYDVLLAQNLNRAYSLRMYKLVSEQKMPICMTIDELKEMLQVQDKYKLTADFIRALNSAREELDKQSPWTFSLTPVYSSQSGKNNGRSGRKAITSLVINPVHQLKFDAQNNKSFQSISPRIMLGNEIADKLMKYYEFTSKELTANMPLFATCKKFFGKDGTGPDLFQFLTDLAPNASRADNIQGYVVNALKTHLKERYHMSMQQDKIVQEGSSLLDAAASVAADNWKA